MLVSGNKCIYSPFTLALVILLYLFVTIVLLKLIKKVASDTFLSSKGKRVICYLLVVEI